MAGKPSTPGATEVSKSEQLLFGGPLPYAAATRPR